MLGNNIISLDIGTYSTKIIVGRQQNKGIQVEQAITIPTPPNAYDDGNILSMERLSEALLQALTSNKIKAKKTICTVGSTAIILREIALPAAKPEELDTMVRYEIENYLPIMLDEYVIEHKVLEDFTEEDVKKQRIMVAAMPKKFVEGYLELLKRLKLQPYALDMHTNAISKVFDREVKINDEYYRLDKTVAVIDLGHSFIHTHIISKGLLRFSRIISQGGKDIDSNIANAFNLSLKEASEKKNQLSESSQNHLNSGTAALLSEMTESNINDWSEELQRIFQYYTSRATGNHIDAIYLCGGGAKLENVVNHLSANFQLPVYMIRNISNIHLYKSKDSIHEYLNAIAALWRR
ncbi:type IV pilus assembly protein PilM [Anaerosolibacter sp.]|uniref:type IV pilus assembly protein PilM n=1 Tax=Anaerosolibacter sp. TaxID=1872527 RepID=UPI0039EF7B6B